MENNISIEEFYEKSEFRVGKIYHAEVIPKSNLIKLDVAFGEEDRTVVVNLGHQFTPSRFIGIHTVFITNLPKVIIRGIESEAMLFTGTTPTNKNFVIDLGEHIPLGSKIG